MRPKELPEGWEWIKLGEISERIHYGYTASAENKKVGPKLLRITDIQDNNVDWATVPYCPISEKDLPNYLLKSGDLVFARTGATVGKSFLIEGDIPESVFASYLIRVILKKNVDPKFIYCFFQSPLYWNQIEQKKVGAGQENVNSQKLAQIEIPLPPLPLQRQIVAVLERAEAVKRQRHEADALTGALLQSVFLKMFGDPERNDREWAKVKLGDVSKVVVSYVGPINQFFCEKERGVPLLNTTNIKPNGLISNDFRFVLREFHKKNKKSQLHPGDIIVARHGKSGSATIIPDYLIEAQSINNVIIKRSTKMEPDYIRYLLNLSIHSQKMLGLKTGTVQKIINTKQLADFKIPLPPLVLQQQFARVVESVERIREQQVASGRHIEGLCEGLMQRAFGGELAV